MSKHTPWKFDGDAIVDPHGNKLFFIHQADGQDVSKAIAAPEMLEALKNCVRALMKNGHTCNSKAREIADGLKAIAKAEGK